MCQGLHCGGGVSVQITYIGCDCDNIYRLLQSYIICDCVHIIIETKAKYRISQSYLEDREMTSTIRLARCGKYNSLAECELHQAAFVAVGVLSQC